MNSKGLQHIVSFLCIVYICSAQLRTAGGAGGGARSLRQQLARGAQQEQLAGDSLQAADQNAESEETLLNQQQRQQARLDKKARREERRRARRARNEAKRLRAANSLNFANYGNAAEFNELDAASDNSEANKLALSVIQESRLDRSDAIKHSSGAKANTGTRLAHDEFVDTAEMVQELEEGEAYDYAADAVSAADANEDLLDAQQRADRRNQVGINAENRFENRGVFQDNELVGQDAGFNAGFQDNLGFGGGLSGLFGGRG